MNTLLSRSVAVISRVLAAAMDGREQAEADASWRDFSDALSVAIATHEGQGAEPLAELTGLLELGDLELKAFFTALAYAIDPCVARVIDRATKGSGPTVGFIVESFCQAGSEQRPWIVDRVLPLFRLRLALSAAGSSHLARPLRIPPPLVQHLLGLTGLSPCLIPYARLTRPTVELFDVIVAPRPLDTMRRLIAGHDRFRNAAQRWNVARSPQTCGLMLLLSGPSGVGKSRLCEGLANHSQRRLLTVDCGTLPKKPEAAEPLLELLVDEANYRRALLVLDGSEALLGRDDPRARGALRVLQRATVPVVLCAEQPQRLCDAVEKRTAYHCPLTPPTCEQRRQIWEVHLPPELPLALDVDIEALASTYDFDGATIAEAVRLAVAEAVSGRKPAQHLTAAMLDAAARAQLRSVTDDMTVRSQGARLRLDNIVLQPEVQVAVEDVLAACKNQTRVLSQWGFGERLSTGTGITVLFDGPPGTGKTYCAEILASELGRPLFRVNLPEVVSKWVGETEKNLQALFRQARVGHAVLLFDEADALFSRRVNETRSAGDRHANMEVNLLLQEMERYPGVCFLTTNHFEGFDQAVVRRIAYRVTFGRPGVVQRAGIWETLFPAKAPRADDVDFEELAECFDLSGGEIKNSLLRAAYWAADRDEAIGMHDLQRACRREYVATGKLVREVA